MRKISLMICLSLFLVSCGKESSSSGTSYSNLYNSTLPTGSSDALTGLTTWYQGTAEGNYYTTSTTRIEYRTVKTYNASNGCSNQAINVFGINLGSVNLCSNNSSLANSTTVSRSVTPVIAGNSKVGNTKLAQLFSGAVGTLANVTQAQSSFGGMAYTLTFTKATGYQAVYVVDTGINSAFNPVYIIDTEARTEETVSYIQ